MFTFYFITPQHIFKVIELKFKTMLSQHNAQNIFL